MIKLERSAAARNGLPESPPYVYRGTGEDIYRGEAGYLQDVRRRAEEVMPDIGPGPEWYRELADEDAVRRAPVPAPVPPRPALSLPPAPPDGGELDGLTATRDRYQAAMAAVPEPRKPEPLPAPPPVTAAARCRRCKYLRTSAGHRVACGD